MNMSETTDDRDEEEVMWQIISKYCPNIVFF